MSAHEQDGERWHWNEVDDLFAPAKRRAAERSDDESRRLVDAMASVLETMHGREIVWWLIESCGVHSEMFAAYPRALEHAYFAGQRSIGCDVLALALKADPEAYAKFLNEKLKPKKEKQNG